MQQLEQRDRSIFGKNMRSEVPLEKGREHASTNASGTLSAYRLPYIGLQVYVAAAQHNKHIN